MTEVVNRDGAPLRAQRGQFALKPDRGSVAPEMVSGHGEQTFLDPSDRFGGPPVDDADSTTALNTW